MKNEHLVPVNISDLVNKLNDKTMRENEKQNYVLRLESTAEYINEALMKHRSQKSVPKPNTRMFR
jgi:hypothetical protein